MAFLVCFANFYIAAIFLCSLTLSLDVLLLHSDGKFIARSIMKNWKRSDQKFNAIVEQIEEHKNANFEHENVSLNVFSCEVNLNP
jgi:hypothetical protein